MGCSPQTTTTTITTTTTPRDQPNNIKNQDKTRKRKSTFCRLCCENANEKDKRRRNNEDLTILPDIDFGGAYGILKSSNSNIYYGQGAFGPTLVPETCKYPDCESNSNCIVVGGVPHVVNLPEGLQSWENSYMSSPLNQDRELGEVALISATQLYAMQPQRPCSNATGRVLVNVIPVCEDCDNDEHNDVKDPCHMFQGSSYDWSTPLHFGQGSNYLVEDTTGGGFMSNYWD